MGTAINLQTAASLPALGEPDDPEFLENVKEILELWLSQRGDALDAVVTKRFLFQKGLIDVLLEGVQTSYNSPQAEPGVGAGASVTTIADRSIAAVKLVLATITAAEIAANTITAAKIAAGTITAAEIAAVTITAAEIAAGTITAAEIAAGTITADEIAALTITGAKIANATITANKLVAPGTTAVSATAYTVLTTDHVILVDATANNVTIDLLAVATATDGYKLTIKRIDSSANTVTIDGNGAETIDGSTTLAVGTLGSPNDSKSLVSDGTEYWTI